MEVIRGYSFYIDGLQKLREFSTGFVEGLWRVHGILRRYRAPVVLWSDGLGPVVRVYRWFAGGFQTGFREVLRRVHGSGKLDMVASINRGTPYRPQHIFHPYYRDPQNGTPNFRKPPYGSEDACKHGTLNPKL